MDFSVVGNSESLNQISAYEHRIDLTLELQEADQTIDMHGKFAEHCQGEVDSARAVLE
jgi:hypothetical protein